jgi:hypothetical protein
MEASKYNSDATHLEFLFKLASGFFLQALHSA